MFSDGHDLIDLAPSWAAALPHAAFMAPDAPERYDMAPAGRQWFSISDRTPARLLAGVAAAAAALDRCIDAELARLGLPAAGATTSAAYTHACPYTRANPDATNP